MTYPLQPIKLRLGFGLNYRHAFAEELDVSLCATPVPDLTSSYTFLDGDGPFCPSCLRQMTSTIPVPMLTATEASFFVLSAVAVLLAGVLVGIVL